MKLIDLFESVEVIDGKNLWKDVIHREPENEDLTKRIRYLNDREAYHEMMLVHRDGRKVVAMAGLQEAPNEKNVLWIKFISVDPAYQGKGYGKKLAHDVFEYAARKRMRLRASSYTETGAERLKKHLDMLALEFKDRVQFKDASDHMKFPDDAH